MTRSNPPEPAGRPSTDGQSERFWGIVLVVAAGLLFLAGGGPSAFRARPVAGIPDDIGLPEILEPRGLVPSPPVTFRWEPGGDDVELSQVGIFDATIHRIWESRPLEGGVSEVDVPREVFDDISARSQCFWRVREVAGGKPRASSAVVEFIFEEKNAAPSGTPVADE